MLKKTRERRKQKIRSRVSGTSGRPRLSVFRSNKFIYAQLIDDQKEHSLASVKGTNPQKVGEDMVKIIKTKKIKSIVFDRSGYKYHGKVKALAETLRKAKLLN